jgi:uncharacterized membrane protein YqjE
MAEIENRPVSTVLGDIVGNFQEIVRSEVRLARAEIKTELAQALRSGSLIACSVGLALYAFGLLLLGFVFLLARIMEPWIAAWVVCAVVAAVAATLLALGRHRWTRVHLAPEKTVDTVKENVSWMKAQIK